MRIILVLVVLLSGCAQNQIKNAWIPPDQDLWSRSEQTGIWLKNKDGLNHKFIVANWLQNILKAKAKLEEVSSVKADWGIVETDYPNAFAWQHEGKNYFAFSISFLERLGHDIDAIGTTMGHELAHISLKHGDSRKAREAGRQAVGFALGFFLGPAGMLADVGNQAMFNSFTKDEERDADDLGLKWAIQAGFNPCGRVKMAEVFRNLGPAQIPFLSTHPGFSERSELANEYSRKTNGVSCN